MRLPLSLVCTLLVMLGSGLLGCNSGGAGTVKGTVTYQGKPLPTGAVTFIGGGTEPQTVTAPITNGTYTAVGVPAGAVKITVTAPPPSAPPPPGTPAAGPATDSVPIPAKYGFADQSGLGYTVTSGEQTHDIALN
jgi:hypothetical protein